jgi:hypothetical protein
MKIVVLLIGISLAYTLSSHAQTSDSSSSEPLPVRRKNFSALAGYNFWKNHFLEGGLSINRIETDGYRAGGAAYSASCEIRIGKELLFGPKLGVWLGSDTGGIGLNLICYTDGKSEAWRLRPEMGLGLSHFKLAYGYNLALSNKEFDNVNKSNISIQVMIGVKKLR